MCVQVCVCVRVCCGRVLTIEINTRKGQKLIIVINQSLFLYCWKGQGCMQGGGNFPHKTLESEGFMREIASTIAKALNCPHVVKGMKL